MKQYTNNIYNDLEKWNNRTIGKLVERMRLNSYTDIKRIYDNTNIKLKYELVVKLKGELDQRVYTYNELNEVTTASYFIYLLVQHEGYEKIEDYRMFAIVEDEKGNTVIEDIIDNYHCWNTVEAQELKKEKEQLLKELEIYKMFMNQYNVNDTFNKFKESIV